MTPFGERGSGLPDGAELADAVDSFLRSRKRSPETAGFHEIQVQPGNEVQPLSLEVLETYQEEFLGKYFRNIPERATRAVIDIRTVAANFRDFFRACLGDCAQLAQLLEIDKKAAEKLISQLTLSGFADFAKKKFEAATRRSGATLPGSFEEGDNRRNADYWGYVEQIVREASEMKD